MNTYAKRTQRTYTEEQYEKVETLVNTHNEEVKENLKSRSDIQWDDRLLFVELTGNKHVYFTLYSYHKPISAFIDPYSYIKNLSIDLEEAVNQALSIAKKRQIVVFLCAEDNHNPYITNFRKRTKEGIPNIPFGKYRGMTIAQVWDIDEKYVMWFHAEYKTKPYNGRMPQMNEEDVMLRKNAKDLIDLFFENKAEENRQTSTSKYVGVLKDRYVHTLTIAKIKVKQDSYDEGGGYILNTATDSDGNQYEFYGKCEIEVGKTYLIKGTIVDHKERLGIKTTRINRVVIESEINK